MELESPSIPMETTGKILRKSIHTFLQNYQFFTTTAALLSFPFPAAILLSQSLLPSSSLFPKIHILLHSLFDAAGISPSSLLFTLISPKLSQTITCSVLVLPFTLSFLLISKASIIQILHHQKKSPSLRLSFPSLLSIYNPILLTKICSSLVILSANTTYLCLLLLAFDFFSPLLSYSSPTSLLFLSATGAVLYSVILAHSLIICNLALILSGMEKKGGFLAILKACVLIRGRTSTALALSLLVNIAHAGVQALFQYRVVRAYYQAKSLNSFMASEGIFIAYLYSIIVVIDNVVSCVFHFMGKG